MLVGVLSDTHGRTDTTAQGIKLLRSAGAEYLIHCGDVGGERILDLLVGVPSAFVWGNCDYDQYALQRYSQIIGVSCRGALGRKTFDGRTISFLHGDDHRQMHRILEDQDCDLLLHGHTHVRGVKDVGRIRVVNPGALHRAMVRTVALIDTTTRDVRFLTVP